MAKLTNIYQTVSGGLQSHKFKAEMGFRHQIYPLILQMTKLRLTAGDLPQIPQLVNRRTKPLTPNSVFPVLRASPNPSPETLHIPETIKMIFFWFFLTRSMTWKDKTDYKRPLQIFSKSRQSTENEVLPSPFWFFF